MRMQNEIRRLEKEFDDISAYEEKRRALHDPNDPETYHYKKNADTAKDQLKELKKRLINLKHNYEKEPYQKRGYFNNYRTTLRSWNSDRKCNFKYMIVETNKDGSIDHQAPISHSRYENNINNYDHISTEHITAKNGTTPLICTIYQSKKNSRNFIYEYSSTIDNKICRQGGYDTKPSAPKNNHAYYTEPNSVIPNTNDNEKSFEKMIAKMKTHGFNESGQYKSPNPVPPYPSRFNPTRQSSFNRIRGGGKHKSRKRRKNTKCRKNTKRRKIKY